MRSSGCVVLVFGKRSNAYMYKKNTALYTIRLIHSTYIYVRYFGRILCIFICRRPHRRSERRDHIVAVADDTDDKNNKLIINQLLYAVAYDLRRRVRRRRRDVDGQTGRRERTG